MRICRAAGLVILVNNWARFGSGSRPFLLLKIWRRRSRETESGERRKTGTVCVCVWAVQSIFDVVISSHWQSWFLLHKFTSSLLCLRCQRWRHSVTCWRWSGRLKKTANNAEKWTQLSSGREEKKQQLPKNQSENCTKIINQSRLDKSQAGKWTEKHF